MEPLAVQRPPHVPDELRVHAGRLERTHLRNDRLVDQRLGGVDAHPVQPLAQRARHRERRDRKSTRLNSSHLVISYAVFCLKKKKNIHYKLTIDTQPNTRSIKD